MHLPMEPLPAITLVFCALEGLSAMRVRALGLLACPCMQHGSINAVGSPCTGASISAAVQLAVLPTDAAWQYQCCWWCPS